MTKKNKWILIILIVLLSLASLMAIRTYREVKRIRSWVIDSDELKRTENKFKDNPSFNDCVYLLDIYSFLRRYHDSITVGEKCVKMNLENYETGWLIHIRLAIAYSKIGDIDKIRENIRSAVTLDKRGIIEKGQWIDTLKAEGIDIEKYMAEIGKN